MLRKLLCLCLLTVCVTPAGFAQFALDVDALRGMKTFAVLVEDLDQSATVCGLSDSAIETAVKFPLSQSRAKLLPKPMGTYLYVHANVIHLARSDLCVYSISLTFKSDVAITETGRRVIAGVWDTSAVGVAPRAQAAKAVTDGLERLAKKFVVDWSAGN